MTARPYREHQPGPSAIDVFCGCGGASLGMYMAGFDLWCGIDLSKDALQTYQYNLGNAIMADAWHLPLRPNLEPDLLIGCPPCPPFSSAARTQRKHSEKTRKRHAEMARLLIAFAGAVQYLNPKTIFFENVPPTMKSLEFKEMCELLQMETFPPYQIEYQILDCADYGVPQHRKRLFLIGKRCDKFFVAEVLPLHMPNIDHNIKRFDQLIEGQDTLIRWVIQRDRHEATAV